MSRAQLQPGQMLGSYRIVRKIGQGGMGEVYEAWEGERTRRIAIKILKAEPLIDGPAAAEMNERFRNEGRALARLKHGNVVSLYTLGEYEGRVYMAMEYIDGVPLDHFMLGHACSLGDLLILFRQMVEGLAAAHEAGIIHRDLKPANVVIDRRMTAKLVDFGIAKMPADQRSVETSRDVVIGTVNYLSPEVAAGKPATPQSDIYSLGLVLFHMLTGTIPFIGRSNFETLEKIRTTYLVFGPRLQVLVPDEIKRIVDRMTHKAPNQRYQNAREILADLDHISLAYLPTDLRQSNASGFPIGNYTEVRKRCESLGFDASELRFILAIAAAVEADRASAPEEDATEKIEARPLIEISEPSLDEGVRRYRQAKMAMSSRRSMLVPQQPQRQMPEENSAFSASTFLSIMVLGLSALYSYQVMRAHFLRQSVRSWPAIFGLRDPASVPASAPATARVIEPKRPRPGFSLSFTGTPDDTPTWTLKEDRGDTLVWEDAKGQREQRTPNPFLPPLSNATVENQITGNVMSLFPLQSGRTATYRVISHDKTSGQTSEYDMHCAVGAESTLKLPSGTFQVIQVDCASENGPHDVFQYAPQLGHWIKLDRSGGKAATPRQYSLSGYSLGS